MPANDRWKRAFRFSLGGMLFATLCMCGFLGSERSGRLAGAQDRYDESYFVKIYGLADLLVDEPTAGDRDQLVATTIVFLKSTVAPESWGNSDDGVCEIQPFPAAGNIVVSQHGAVHDQIDRALSTYRDQRSRKRINDATQAIETLVAKEQSEPVVLSSLPTAESLALAAIEQRFENTVRNVADRWGEPKFTGKCTDPGFPIWSVAQSIATWNAGDGVAYVALQEWPEVGCSLVAGWRRRD